MEKKHNSLEASNWESDVIQWDRHNWKQALPFWEKHAGLKPGMHALGIGERGGGLSLWLAMKGLRVVCSDYNPMPDSTAVLHKKYGMDHLISYDRQDACTLTYADKSFDVVILKSVLGALGTKERQQQAIDEFYRVLKPGGVLLFAENTAGTKFHMAVRKKFAGWSSYWRYPHPKTDMDLFDKFAKKDCKMIGFWGFVGKGALELPMRLADILSRPFVPKHWRYILVGVFQK